MLLRIIVMIIYLLLCCSITLHTSRHSPLLVHAQTQCRASTVSAPSISPNITTSSQNVTIIRGYMAHRILSLTEAYAYLVIEDQVIVQLDMQRPSELIPLVGSSFGRGPFAYVDFIYFDHYAHRLWIHDATTLWALEFPSDVLPNEDLLRVVKVGHFSEEIFFVTAPSSPDLVVLDSRRFCIEELSYTTNAIALIAGKCSSPGNVLGPAKESQFRQIISPAFAKYQDTSGGQNNNYVLFFVELSERYILKLQNGVVSRFIFIDPSYSPIDSMYAVHQAQVSLLLMTTIRLNCDLLTADVNILGTSLLNPNKGGNCNFNPEAIFALPNGTIFAFQSYNLTLLKFDDCLLNSEVPVQGPVYTKAQLLAKQNETKSLTVTEDKLSSGAIAGIIIAVVLFFILIVIAVIVLKPSQQGGATERFDSVSISVSKQADNPPSHNEAHASDAGESDGDSPLHQLFSVIHKGSPEEAATALSPQRQHHLTVESLSKLPQRTQKQTLQDFVEGQASPVAVVDGNPLQHDEKDGSWSKSGSICAKPPSMGGSRNSSNPDDHLIDNPMFNDIQDKGEIARDQHNSKQEVQFRERQEQIQKGEYLCERKSRATDGTLIDLPPTIATYTCRLKDGTQAFLREIPLCADDEISKLHISRLAAELHYLESFSHTNLVRYYGLTHDIQYNVLSVFSEKFSGMSLGSMVQYNRGGLTEFTVKNFTKQMLEGLAFLHQNGVAHRAVCAKNLFLVNGYVKLTALGRIAEIASQSRRRASINILPRKSVVGKRERVDSDSSSHTGSSISSCHFAAEKETAILNEQEEYDARLHAWYECRVGEITHAPPEILLVAREFFEIEKQFQLDSTSTVEHGPLSPQTETVVGANQVKQKAEQKFEGQLTKFLTPPASMYSDIWAIGVTVAELCSKCESPWPYSTTQELVEYVLEANDAYPHVPDAMSAAAGQFVRRCCQKDPKKRPEVSVLLNDKWFREH